MESRAALGDGLTLAPPSQVPFERRRALELIWTTALFDLRRRYAGSVIGLGWAVLEPIVWSFVLYFVFTRVIRFGGDVDHYVVVLLLNVLLFWFFRDAARTAMRSLASKRAIVRNVQAPRAAFGLSAVLTTTLFLPINLFVVFVWILADGVRPTATWLLLPVLLAYLLAVTVVAGLLLAALYARWRDTDYFWRPLSRVLFLASGVIFPFEIIRGEVFRQLAALNPLSPVFVQAREWIVDPSAPNWIEASGSTLAAILPFAVLAALAVVTALSFNPLTRRAAESM